MSLLKRLLARDPAVASTTEVLVLSPHCDDAVWSIGALIAALRPAPLVITAFDDMGVAPSWVGRAFLERAGLTVNAASEARRAEDRGALAVVGASVLHLGLPDAVARCPHDYATPEQLAGPQAQIVAHDPATTELIARLAEVIDAKPARSYVLLAPYAIGRHVDHQVARAAAAALATAQTEVWFYEEFPYSSRRSGHSVTKAEEQLSPLVDLGHIEVDVSLTAPLQVEAGCVYESQVRAFYASTGAFVGAMRDHLYGMSAPAGTIATTTLVGPLTAQVRAAHVADI